MQLKPLQGRSNNNPRAAMDFQTTPPQRLPPRFVPTLTEVVHLPMNATETVSNGGAWAEQAPAYAYAPLNAPMPAPMPVDLNAQIVHRVMQRVDATLSRSLREAVADLVLLTPLLFLAGQRFL